jgi:hypothetical protein
VQDIDRCAPIELLFAEASPTREAAPVTAATIAFMSVVMPF